MSKENVSKTVTAPQVAVAHTPATGTGKTLPAVPVPRQLLAVPQEIQPAQLVAGETGGGRQLFRPMALPSPVAQLAIIVDGQPGAGRMAENERGTLEQFLIHNNIDPLAFTAAMYATLTTRHGRLLPLDTKVSTTSAGKKVTAKATLKTAYTQFKADVNAGMLKDGNADWDAAVTLGVQQYDNLLPAEKTNTDQKYTDIAGPLWPTVQGRGAMPDSFWKAIRKACRLAHGAVVAAAAGAAYSAECDLVYADMGTQFAAWTGTLATRGAWYGSAAPGSTAGARDVSSTVIRELAQRAGAPWVFSNSFSGGISFHRPRAGAAADFIYHMQSP
jgi:hypothetical protein